MSASMEKEPFWNTIWSEEEGVGGEEDIEWGCEVEDEGDKDKDVWLEEDIGECIIFNRNNG